MDSLDSPSLDEAIERIEETILPSISMMLDTLLDAANAAQAGTDAHVYAAELKTLALQLEALTQQVEGLSSTGGQPKAYPAKFVA